MTVASNAERVKRFYLAHPNYQKERYYEYHDENKAKSLTYHHSHKTECNKRSLDWHYANREEHNAKMRIYNIKNKERIKARRRERYAEDPDRELSANKKRAEMLRIWFYGVKT